MNEYQITDTALSDELVAIVGHRDPVDAEIIAITTTVLYALPEGHLQTVFVPTEDLSTVNTGDTVRLIPSPPADEDEVGDEDEDAALADEAGTAEEAAEGAEPELETSGSRY